MNDASSLATSVRLASLDKTFFVELGYFAVAHDPLLSLIAAAAMGLASTASIAAASWKAR
jgi:hypothetical protein